MTAQCKWLALALVLSALAVLSIPASAQVGSSTGITYIYVCNSNDDTVSVIDASTRAVLTVIPVGDDPRDIAISPDGRRAYITESNSNSISVIDTGTTTVIASIGTGSFPAGLAIAPDGSKVYVANHNDGTVTVIDTATLGVSSTIGGFIMPVAVKMNPAGTKAYVLSNLNYFAVVNVSDDTLLETVALPGGALPLGGIVSPDGMKLYLGDFMNDRVLVYNTTDKTQEALIADVLYGPVNMVFNPSGSLLYTANYNLDRVSVIDVTGNVVIGQVNTGLGAWGIAYDEGKGSIYTACELTDSVDVIDPALLTVVDSIAVGNGPHGLAIVSLSADQANTGQPRVDIVEGAMYAQQSTFNGTYGFNVSGYVNVTNVADYGSLYNINLLLDTIPAGVTLTYTGAYVFNASGGPFLSTDASISTGSIHINQLAANTTIKVAYVMTGVNLSTSTAYGIPEIVRANETVYFRGTGGSWFVQGVSYNSTAGAYVVDDPLAGAGHVSMLLAYNNTDSAGITGMRLKKQLPRTGNASTGNATFTPVNVTYWSGSIPFTNLTGAIGPTNLIDVIIPGTLSPGDTLYFKINCSVSNASGNEIPYGSGQRYINMSPAYLEFATDKPNSSYLGSFITGMTGGGDAIVSMQKGYDAISGKWEYRTLINNPANISFWLDDIRIYRNSWPNSGNISTAALIETSSTAYALDPGTTWDSDYITDTGYAGGVSMPPVYWVRFNFTVNAEVVFDPGHYTQRILVSSGNVTFIEPYFKVADWKARITKITSFDIPSGKYLVNITVSNTGAMTAPSGTKAYDYIPQGMTATGFIKNGTAYTPDYNGASTISGPRSIGWNVTGLGSGASLNLSYVATGNVAVYDPADMYVTGIDPRDDEAGADGFSTIHALMLVTMVCFSIIVRRITGIF